MGHAGRARSTSRMVVSPAPGSEADDWSDISEEISPQISQSAAAPNVNYAERRAKFRHHLLERQRYSHAERGRRVKLGGEEHKIITDVYDEAPAGPVSVSPVPGRVVGAKYPHGKSAREQLHGGNPGMKRSKMLSRKQHRVPKKGGLGAFCLKSLSSALATIKLGPQLLKFGEGPKSYNKKRSSSRHETSNHSRPEIDAGLPRSYQSPHEAACQSTNSRASDIRDIGKRQPCSPRNVAIGLDDDSMEDAFRLCPGSCALDKTSPVELLAGSNTSRELECIIALQKSRDYENNIANKEARQGERTRKRPPPLLYVRYMDPRVPPRARSAPI